MKEPTGAVLVSGRVIISKLNGTANYDMPQCQLCGFSRARQLMADGIKTKVVESPEGAISCDKYQTGDYVSMDQYMMVTSGCSPIDFGKE